jgi:serine/threonine-protein kinase
MERRMDDPSVTETVAQTSPSLPRISSTSSHDEGRFIAGTLLGGRYRIIGLLGRGGMGEVYRATDLTLGQSVALKFLPEEAAGNNRLLERFAGEVRVARQVSHPNVCRVYDLGEVDGAPFISMEYVDGEDLASLLPRIGRLPADKAMETARKICAGLAAAHDRGIIHRDLKPQNIMMNKRGDVVIMDFGLAAIADQLSGAEARNGTPAYMAPEQLKGAEVTARSDIYALGLVLYELFTGKRPYDAKTVPQLLSQQESAQLTSMTSLAADIDPAVERAIRRCLDPDPLKRPASALAVSAALPGGDPLAAALAAGETPSPELVAAAGKTEGMALKYSVPCLALTLLCILTAPAIRQHGYAFMHGSLDFPPEVLASKAREHAVALGYPQKPADSYISIVQRGRLISYLQKFPMPRNWDAWLEAEAPLMAEYREALSPLDAEPYGNVAEENPPLSEPGMVNEKIDGHGLLREFSAVPYDENPAAAPIGEEAFFRAAGVDQMALKEMTPKFLPRHAADRVAAWGGPHPKIPNTEIRVEIAWWKGRVTQAQVVSTWDWTAEPPSARQTAISQARQWLNIALLAAGVFFGILLARRNWRKDRVDKKGAARVAIAELLIVITIWIGQVHPLPGTETLGLLINSAGEWVFSAILLWTLYLALEPAVRAHWPHSIVTWNRVLAGRWKDAQVGSHILIGAAVGAGMWTTFELIRVVAGPKNNLSQGLSLWQLLSTRAWFGSYASVMDESLKLGLIAFFGIFGLRQLLKKDWLAALAAALLFTMMNGDIGSEGTGQGVLLATAIYTSLYSGLLFVLLRVGLVSTISAVFFINGTNHICLGADWKAWWAPSGFATIFLLLALTCYAFWRSIGARDVVE